MKPQPPATPEKIVGTGFYRNAAPGTFGPSEWLDLLMACQDGRATCLRVMEFIERETIPIHHAVAQAKTAALLNELLGAVTSKFADDTSLPVTWSGSASQNRRMYNAIDRATYHLTQLKKGAQKTP